jgi:hypothetical protein
MTLELAGGVEERACELEKWTRGEGEGERVFIAKGRVVINLEEAVDCFTEAVRGKARL